MTSVLQYLPAIFGGLTTTVIVAALSIGGCVAVSLVLGIIRSAKGPLLKAAAGGIVELLRGASALIYLFWIYYALPLIPGMPQFSPFAASIMVLSLVGGAYGAEIVRGGIQAVSRNQTDACRALALPRWIALTRVILPQALSQIVPAFGSLAVDLVKWTSIVGFVGVQDVLYVGNAVRSITYETAAAFLTVAALYWTLCFLVGLLFRAIEWMLPLSRAMRAARQSAPASMFRRPLSAEPVLQP
jgi:polar amino acid transport system permease protein